MSEDQVPRRRERFGMTGVIVGAVALAVGIGHVFLGPINPPPPFEEVVAGKLVGLRDAVAGRLSGTEYRTASADSRRLDADRVLEAATALAGVSALLLGMVGFIRREDLRVSGSAAALGTAAIALHFVLIGLGAFVLGLLVVGALSVLGSG